MKIINSHSQQVNISAKSGLKPEDIKAVQNMSPQAYEIIVKNLKERYGINANVAGSNTVAYCLNKVVDAMAKAGFQLPSFFEFSPKEEHIFGSYNLYQDKVVINSNIDAFYDLNSQNLLEESDNSYFPKRGHFLQTYLHEFSHAAHYKNLCKRFGKDKAFDLIMNELGKYTPNDVIVGPYNAKLKRIFSNGFSSSLENCIHNVIDNFFPLENGSYAKTSLTEYFAEYNARRIAQKMSPNFYINPYKTILEDMFNSNFNASSYEPHPINYNLEENLKASRTALKIARILRFVPNFSIIMSLLMQKDYLAEIEKILNVDLNYTNGDIYHGEIDLLKDKSCCLNY